MTWLPGSRVSVLTAHDNYWIAINGGNDRLSDVGIEDSTEFERFLMWPETGWEGERTGRFMLQATFAGGFVRDPGGGADLDVRGDMGGPGVIFSLVATDEPHYYAFQTESGRYVSSLGSATGSVTAAATAIGVNEKHRLNYFRVATGKLHRTRPQAAVPSDQFQSPSTVTRSRPMSAFEMGREFERMRVRLGELERLLTRRRRAIRRKVFMPPPPSVAEPGPGPDILVDTEWTPPFNPPVVPISTLYASGGSRVNDITINAAIDRATGRLQLNVGDSTTNVDDDDDGYKDYGCWFEFSFFTPYTGQAYFAAEFSVDTSVLQHDVLDEFGASAVYAYALHEHFIRLWVRDSAGAFKSVGFMTGGYNSWLWDVTDGNDHTHHSDKSNVACSISVNTGAGQLPGGTQVWAQVGILSEIKFSTNDYSISTSSVLNSRLTQVLAGITDAVSPVRRTDEAKKSG